MTDYCEPKARWSEPVPPADALDHW